MDTYKYSCIHTRVYLQLRVVIQSKRFCLTYIYMSTYTKVYLQLYEYILL